MTWEACSLRLRTSASPSAWQSIGVVSAKSSLAPALSLPLSLEASCASSPLYSAAVPAPPGMDVLAPLHGPLCSPCRAARVAGSEDQMVGRAWLQAAGVASEESEAEGRTSRGSEQLGCVQS